MLSTFLFADLTLVVIDEVLDRSDKEWLTHKMMATLCDVDVCTIKEHIKKIYSDSELEEDSTIRNFRIVQTEGTRQVTRDTEHYSLRKAE